jgi:putative transposase
MSIKHTQTETEQTYFCSFTCLNWMPLFEMTKLYEEIYKWFNILVKENHQILGFVIMPNHLHLLVHIGKSEKTINVILANGKRFLAYEIVKRLIDAKREDVLQVLTNHVAPEERKRKKKHRVFQPSCDIKPCYTERFVLQKLNYIHTNPITGKWNLANTFVDYPHSSAVFYEKNQQHPYIHVTYYADAG